MKATKATKTKPAASAASTAAKPKHRKTSQWCAKCLRGGKKVAAILYANGNRDTYCRVHKRDYMKKWMKKTRLANPHYGEPQTKPKAKAKAKAAAAKVKVKVKKAVKKK